MEYDKLYADEEFPDTDSPDRILSPLVDDGEDLPSGEDGAESAGYGGPDDGGDASAAGEPDEEFPDIDGGTGPDEDSGEDSDGDSDEEDPGGDDSDEDDSDEDDSDEDDSGEDSDGDDSDEDGGSPSPSRRGGRNAAKKDDGGDGGKKNTISSDLIRGHINTIILRTLYDGDRYGYDIINEIEKRSHGQYTLRQPTLYSALKRLEAQGYVKSYWGGVSNGGRRKYFNLTDAGRAVTEQNQSEWEYSRTIIDSLISQKDFDFSNEPPSKLDLRILQAATSRTPIVKKQDTPSEYDPIFSAFPESPELAAEEPAAEEPAAEAQPAPAQPAPEPEPAPSPYDSLAFLFPTLGEPEIITTECASAGIATLESCFGGGEEEEEEKPPVSEAQEGLERDRKPADAAEGGPAKPQKSFGEGFEFLVDDDSPDIPPDDDEEDEDDEYLRSLEDSVIGASGGEDSPAGAEEASGADEASVGGDSPAGAETADGDPAATGAGGERLDAMHEDIQEMQGNLQEMHEDIQEIQDSLQEIRDGLLTRQAEASEAAEAEAAGPAEEAAGDPFREAVQEPAAQPSPVPASEEAYAADGGSAGEGRNAGLHLPLFITRSEEEKNYRDILSHIYRYGTKPRAREPEPQPPVQQPQPEPQPPVQQPQPEFQPAVQQPQPEFQPAVQQPQPEPQPPVQQPQPEPQPAVQQPQPEPQPAVQQPQPEPQPAVQQPNVYAPGYTNVYMSSNTNNYYAQEPQPRQQEYWQQESQPRQQEYWQQESQPRQQEYWQQEPQPRQQEYWQQEPQPRQQEYRQQEPQPRQQEYWQQEYRQQEPQPQQEERPADRRAAYAEPAAEAKPEPAPAPVRNVPHGRMDFQDIYDQAAEDGLRVWTAGGALVKNPSKEDFYNKGLSLLRASLVSFMVGIAETVIAAVFRDTFGLGWPYLLVMLICSVLPVCVCLGLYLGKYQPHCRKLKNNNAIYNGIVAFITVFILLVAIDLIADVSFTDVWAILKYIVIPCVFLLNIIVFAAVYYVQSKSKT